MQLQLRGVDMHGAYPNYDYGMEYIDDYDDYKNSINEEKIRKEMRIKYEEMLTRERVYVAINISEYEKMLIGLRR